MEVIILGTGCAKCKQLYELVQEVINESGIDVNLSKQEDIMEIMKYNIMTMPGLVVDGTVKVKGYVPSENEIRKALNI
ncbi:MAG: thioredoxin family protein [Bacteroidales bacterium]|jgi:small redox-active disulfide protein 2|nr:thioredoxin family protein [Bacteroidales bacterium]